VDFVLSKSLGQSICAKDIGTFYIRRIFRIFPVHIVCLSLFLLTTSLLYKSIPSASQFYRDVFGNNFAIKEILKNLLLIQNNLNAVTWTLSVELASCLVIPIFCAINPKPNHVEKTIIAILLIIIGYYFHQYNLLRLQKGIFAL
jgi:peptidoglycan/LPS O-acetylase OafA/YrhL